MADVAAIALDEYGVGVVGGRVVSEAELREAHLFLDEAPQAAAVLPEPVVTSAFLFLMAFSFAGQGVAELQDAGVISVTRLDWMPPLPALGIFPTAQTLVSQLLIATALLAALL